MKKIGMLVMLLLAIIPVSAEVTVSGSDKTILLGDITADTSFSKDYGELESGSKTIKLYLPFALRDMALEDSWVELTAALNSVIDLTVNTIVVANNYEISEGETVRFTLEDFEEAGVDMDATTLVMVINLDVGKLSSISVALVADDAPIQANFSYSVSESKISRPSLEYYKEDSKYTVKHTIQVTQDSSVDLTDLKAVLIYPDNAINQPITNYNFGNLNSGQSKTLAVTFQKWGPYVSKARAIDEGTKYIASFRVSSLENLTASALIDPYDLPWSTYFPDFDPDRIIAVTLNGKPVEWEWDSISIPSMSLKEGTNYLNVSYSKPQAPLPPPITPPQPNTFLGIPLFIWLIIGILFVLILVYPRKRERQL